jgi:hypothetical protein
LSKVPPPKIVISTEGGAFAAVVEKSAVAFVLAFASILLPFPSRLSKGPELDNFDPREPLVQPIRERQGRPNKALPVNTLPTRYQLISIR